MAKNNLQFQGFKEVEQILAALPKSLGAKVVQKALRDGSKPLIKQAKSNASNADVTGNLTKSIGAINGKGLGKGAQVYVGPRRGGGPNGKGYHAHLLEYGVAPHLIKPEGKKALKFGDGFANGVNHPGHAAFPFMRPAWDTSNEQVTIAIAKNLREVLQSNFKGVFK